jgi:signal transduction histidine kinase
MIRPSRLGIQARTTIGATLALALALALGGLILRAQLSDALARSIVDQTVTRAQGVANLVATGDYTTVLDAPGPSPGWIQVIDDSGRIVASTANVRQLRVPFAPLPADGRARSERLSGLAIDTGERVTVASVPISDGKRELTVLAASPLDVADSADRRVITSLLALFPGLLIIGALAVSTVSRRALRPVETIRRDVAAISTTDLSRRVPEPSTHDEIGRLAHTMNDMLGRLETSVNRQRQFVGDASHELKNPLASLRNQLEVSTLDNPDPQWAATVADMLIDHDRLQRLVADLLLLARHDDRAPITTEPLDLGHLVRSELARRPEAPGLVRRVDAENVLVEGDPVLLERVLRNLVDNAERHARSEVHIGVHVVGERGLTMAELFVEDDGPGIPDELRSLVFERFHRLDDARTTDAGGSGLGLAIVSDLVDSHGGTVSAASGAVGAKLVVRLPVLTG